MVKNILKKIIIATITLEARLVLKKYKPKIVAITGNTGKTGAKDAVAAILGAEFFTWKNEKSYNSDIGIPLTILHCKNAWSNPLFWIKNIIEGLVLVLFPHDYPKWLILEVGADKPNDIGKFPKWLRPDVVIVTRIGETPVHVEFFSSRDELIKEKAKLVLALKTGGVLVLNADDPDVLAMKEIPKLAKIVTYVFSPDSSLRASNYHATYNEGIAFKIDYLGNIIPVRLTGVVGRQNVYSALAAFAVGVALGFNFVSMLESINRFERPAGRLKLVFGRNGSSILDDTYNSSPAALDLAIESASDLETPGRRIAVLGDMLELGKHTDSAHRAIGQKIPHYFSLLFTVGQRAGGFVRGAVDAHMDPSKIVSFSDSVSAGEHLKNFLEHGDLVLVKGSQGMRMERVVERIMAKPEDKGKLLARQDEEWLKR